jgi:hypothetical protein
VSSTDNLADDNASIKIYPNPSSSQITVRLNESGKGKLTIYTAQGKSVFQSDIRDNISELTISLKDWQARIYHMEFLTEKGARQTASFVKIP